MPTIRQTHDRDLGLANCIPVHVTDLRVTGEEHGTCCRCQRTSLRFVHTVEHPDIGLLEVGSECAKRLCFGYQPEREEMRLKNLWSRRNRWLTRNWATSSNGNDTLKFKHAEKRVRVTVFRKFGAFSYSITVDQELIYSPTGYATNDEAKFGAFDRIATILEW